MQAAAAGGFLLLCNWGREISAPLSPQLSAIFTQERILCTPLSVMSYHLTQDPTPDIMAQLSVCWSPRNGTTCRENIGLRDF